MRRVLAYLLGLPFALVGEFAAHQGAYLAVHGSHTHAVLAETGHGYLENLPSFALALIVVLAAAGLVDGFLLARGRSAASLPLRTFLLIGPAAFAIQEFAERWAETGRFPWWAWSEASFLLGMVLQLPTAWLAFHLSRAILRPIRRIATRVADRILGRGPGQGYRRSSPARSAVLGSVRILLPLTAPVCVRGRAPPQPTV